MSLVQQAEAINLFYSLSEAAESSSEELLELDEDSVGEVSAAVRICLSWRRFFAAAFCRDRALAEHASKKEGFGFGIRAAGNCF